MLPKRFVEEVSSWLNASNRCGRYSSLMPMPVSRKVSLSVTFPSYRCFSSIRKVTVPPSGVNLTALPSMLIMTCLSFILSPV